MDDFYNILNSSPSPNMKKIIYSTGGQALSPAGVLKVSKGSLESIQMIRLFIQ